MRVARSVAMLVAALLVLAGCAVTTDPTWTPPAWAEREVTVSEIPEPMDAASAGPLVFQRLRNDTVGIQARIALVPAAAPVNDRLLAVVRDAVAGRAAAVQKAYTPQVLPRGAGMGERACVRGSTLRPAAEVLADPSLGPAGGAGVAVVCDVVAAAGTVFGERVRVVQGHDGIVESDSASIIYTDVGSGAVVSAAELWAPDAPAAVWAALVEALRREAGALSLAELQPPDEAALVQFAPALATTVPARDGALVLTVPAGFTAPELSALGVAPTAEPTTFAVPPALARPLTAPVGTALVDAVSSGAAYQAPSPVLAGHRAIDCGLFPCVALTYDDGPSDLTGGILDALAARQAAATFFVLGANVRGLPDVARRTVAEGHLVENHSWNHPHLPALDRGSVARQIHDTSAVIVDTTGQPVAMFRPPYGEYNAGVLAAAGLPAILWDIDTRDWEGIADDVLIQRAIDDPRPGSIVLQHDIHGNTARTAGTVYDGLLDRGFSLVTVAQLFGERMPSSGAWRSAR